MSCSVKSKNINRRKFFNQMLSAAGGLSLAHIAGCAALDRYFEIEKQNYEREVLIFGAGISGLTAAYLLKKNQIPYRIFEASDRVGGRILTQHIDNEGGFFELGASHFDSFDQNVISLAKELDLEIEDASVIPFKDRFGMWTPSEGLVSFKKILKAESKSFQFWNRELIRLKQLSDDDEAYSWLSTIQTQDYEKVFLKDILQDLKFKNSSKLLLKNWAEFYCQKNIEEITLLNWLTLLDFETFQNKRLRIKNGMSELSTNLAQRVSGVIPNYHLQMKSKLIEIQRVNGRWACLIQTKEGPKKITSQFVVLALPLNQLKKVRGIENLFKNSEFTNSILNSTFKSGIRVIGESSTKWETLLKSAPDESISEVMFFDKRNFLAKKNNQYIELNFNDQADYDWFFLEKSNRTRSIFKDFKVLSEYDWKRASNINGTQLKLLSGQAFHLKKNLEDQWKQVSLQLIGDYVISPFNSSLNLSIQSAHRAVKFIMEQYSERITTV